MPLAEMEKTGEVQIWKRINKVKEESYGPNTRKFKYEKFISLLRDILPIFSGS